MIGSTTCWRWTIGMVERVNSTFIICKQANQFIQMIVTAPLSNWNKVTCIFWFHVSQLKYPDTVLDHFCDILSKPKFVSSTKKIRLGPHLQPIFIHPKLALLMSKSKYYKQSEYLRTKYLFNHTPKSWTSQLCPMKRILAWMSEILEPSNLMLHLSFEPMITY